MNAALENEITCGVCSEVYSPVAGREPVMLPECGHTFCRECLLNLQTTAVVCPNCRQRHYSPAVEDLAVNFAQLGIAVALSNIQVGVGYLWVVGVCWVHAVYGMY